MLYTVEDFSKPKNCDSCYLSAGYGCAASGNVLTTKEMKSDKLPKNCPLIEAVPMSDIQKMKEEILNKANRYQFTGYGGARVFYDKDEILGIINRAMA